MLLLWLPGPLELVPLTSHISDYTFPQPSSSCSTQALSMGVSRALNSPWKIGLIIMYPLCISSTCWSFQVGLDVTRHPNMTSFLFPESQFLAPPYFTVFPVNWHRHINKSLKPRSHLLFLPGPHTSTSMAKSSSALTPLLLLFAISHLNCCNCLLPILLQFLLHPAPSYVSGMQWHYTTLLTPSVAPLCCRLL